MAFSQNQILNDFQCGHIIDPFFYYNNYIKQLTIQSYEKTSQALCIIVFLSLTIQLCGHSFAELKLPENDEVWKKIMKIIKNQLEKSHTCEEGGAHLRISFGIY